MDVNMPIMDGLESTREIRRLQGAFQHANPAIVKSVHDTRIVALTASETQEEQKKCMEAGMTSFLGKPPTTVQLRRTLLEALGEDLPENK